MESIFFKNEKFTWYNLDNPDNLEIQKFSKEFQLTSYTVQDAIEAGHLPKFEHQDCYNFVLVRFYQKDRLSTQDVIRKYSHKIGMFIGADFIITVHQKEVSFWKDIIKVLETDKNRDTLLPQKVFHQIVTHSLMTFSEPSEKITDQIEKYEESLFLKENELKTSLKKLFQLKRESSACTKLLILTQDVLKEYKNYTKNHGSTKDLLDLNTKLLHFHTQNTEDLQSLFTLTLSVSDQRSNEIMKILTIFSAFFLPITFLSGVYGMNFEFMPGLSQTLGFFVMVGLMLAIVLVIFLWFKRKKYL